MADRKRHFNSFHQSRDFAPGIEVTGFRRSGDVSSFVGRLLRGRYPQFAGEEANVIFTGVLDRRLATGIASGEIRPQQVPVRLLSLGWVTHFRPKIDQYQLELIDQDLRICTVEPELVDPGSVTSFDLKARLTMLDLKRRTAQSVTSICRRFTFYKVADQSETLYVSSSKRLVEESRQPHEDIDGIERVLAQRYAEQISREASSSARAAQVAKGALARPFRGFESGESRSSRRKH